MNGLAEYRPFSIEAIVPEGWGALAGPLDLISACQVKHHGHPDARPGNEGAYALADWIMEHQDVVAKPKRGTHPFKSGDLIERILIGLVLPSEEFAVSLANMTEGLVLPHMFGRSEADKPSSEPQAPGTGEKAPDAASLSPGSDAAPVSSDIAAPLPPLGALGGALPSGRLFHPIADSRFAEGFVLTGCGVALCLDESTAAAMQAAIAEGLNHIRRVRGASMRKAA